MTATMEKWFLGFLRWNGSEVCYQDHEVELCASNAFDAELVAKKYWRERLRENAKMIEDETGPQFVRAHSPHLIFRKNLFPGSTMFDWDSNKCDGAFLFFTLWEQHSFMEVLIRESLHAQSVDQAWVEAHWIWKAEIRDHRPYSTVRLVSAKPRKEIIYPHTPYLAIRKPFRF